MTLIASADQNWAIGSNNQLLVRIPDDMRFFREITTGKAVVMGRKTKESLPEGILPGRTNIVLTHDQHYKAKGAVIVHSLDELHKELEKYPSEDLSSAERVYTASFWMNAIRRILQKLILHTVQMPVYRIWTSCRSGS